MDIKIEAQKGFNHSDQINYITDSLTNKYEKYPYINDVLIKIALEEGDQVGVSIQIKPEKGKIMFTHGEAGNVKAAFNIAAKRMSTQIEKYKTVHYSSSHSNVIKSQKLK